MQANLEKTVRSDKEPIRSKATIYYITHRHDNPKTGGERYAHKVIGYLKSKGFNIHILEDKLMPKCTKGRRFLSYNFFYIVKFVDARRTVVFTTDYMHPRLFFFFLFLRLFKQVRLFVLVQHFRFHFIDSKLLRFLDKFLDRTFLKCADIVICNRENTKFEVEKLTGNHNNLCVVRPGLERTNLELRRKKPSKGFNILYMGTCMRRKGLEYLVKSLQLLGREEIRLHIGGDKSKEPAFTDYLVELIKQRKLEDKVTFHGWVEGKEKKLLFQNSDIFVLPSLWEGYGQVIAEAMSFGLPIVATKVGAIPELVKERVNGVLVPPKDAQSLAQAISYLMDNPEVRATYGRQGWILSQKFRSWLEVGEKFERIFVQNTKMQFCQDRGHESPR